MKNIDLGNKEVKIRRIKLKRKRYIKDMATKVTEVANFFKKKMTDEELLEIYQVIIENMEFLRVSNSI